MKILFDINKEKIREICINTEKFLLEQNIPKISIDDTIIAIDEVLTNIYEHGYNRTQKTNQYLVSLEVFIGFGRIYIIITDSGKIFSIQDYDTKENDFSDYLKKNDIGGFGIKLIKKMMNVVTQFHLFGENVLIITKDFQEEEASFSRELIEFISKS